MMKFHTITGGRPRVVSAVTLPERTVVAMRSYPSADRFYDGYQWLEGANCYSPDRSSPVLISFSDDTFGVTSEAKLADALAAFDVSIDDEQSEEDQLERAVAALAS